MGELSKLKGIGPKSERCLNEIGIFTRQQLEGIGPVKAFTKMKNEGDTNPSLNFLYAMVGALENRHWSEIARREKERLIFELEDFYELEKIMQSEGKEIDI